MFTNLFNSGAYAIDNDRDTKKLAWHFRNYLSLEELLPEHTRFEASEAEGMFLESAQIFFVGKPKATNGAAWKDLNDKEKDKFQVAIDKEVHSMIEKNKAMRILFHG